MQQRWLRAHRGQRLRLRLIDGKVLSGVLKAWDTFTLEVAIDSDPEPALLFKQAVAYIRRDAGPEVSA